MDDDRDLPRTFSYNVDEDLKTIIKRGIRRTALTVVKEGNPFSSVRSDIIAALETLAVFMWWETTTYRQPRVLEHHTDYKYISSLNKGVVHFYYSADAFEKDDCPMKAIYPIEPKAPRFRKDGQIATMDGMKMAFHGIAHSRAGEMIVTGVLEVLESNENSGGKAQEVFRAHQHYFRVLAEMYGRLSKDDIFKDNGAFSLWLDESWL